MYTTGVCRGDRVSDLTRVSRGGVSAGPHHEHERGVRDEGAAQWRTSSDMRACRRAEGVLGHAARHAICAFLPALPFWASLENRSFYQKLGEASKTLSKSIVRSRLRVACTGCCGVCECSSVQGLVRLL